MSDFSRARRLVKLLGGSVYEGGKNNVFELEMNTSRMQKRILPTDGARSALFLLTEEVKCKIVLLIRFICVSKRKFEITMSVVPSVTTHKRTEVLRILRVLNIFVFIGFGFYPVPFYFRT